MKKILFVDDDLNILRGLENSLSYQRRDWNMCFVGSGREALGILEKTEIDVIVCDMSMPEMDGSELLVAVQERFPTVVRLVLSAHAEFEAVLRAVPIAHHFLVKPCETEKIVEAINRSCILHGLVRDPSISRAVAKIQSLPTLPRNYRVITKALVDPDLPVSEIAAIVEQDVSICTRVLRIANSAALGLRNPVSNVKQALTYLGMNMVKNLVLAVETLHLIESARIPASFSIEQMQRHSLLTAGIARKLVVDRFGSENAYLAGILHDLGKLILLSEFPEKFEESMKMAQGEKLPAHAAEKRVFGVTHAEVGAYLMGLWGLPYPVVEAVAFHHTPQQIPHKGFDALGAVYAANLLAHEHEPAHRREGAESIDLEYLKSVLVHVRLNEWRRLAAEMAIGI